MLLCSRCEFSHICNQIAADCKWQEGTLDGVLSIEEQQNIKRNKRKESIMTALRTYFSDCEMRKFYGDELIDVVRYEFINLTYLAGLIEKEIEKTNELR